MTVTHDDTAQYLIKTVSKRSGVKSDLVRGINPTEEKRKNKIRGMTLQELMNQYLANRVKNILKLMLLLKRKLLKLITSKSQKND